MLYPLEFLPAALFCGLSLCWLAGATLALGSSDGTVRLWVDEALVGLMMLRGASLWRTW